MEVVDTSSKLIGTWETLLGTSEETLKSVHGVSYVYGSCGVSSSDIFRASQVSLLILKLSRILESEGWLVQLD